MATSHPNCHRDEALSPSTTKYHPTMDQHLRHSCHHCNRTTSLLEFQRTRGQAGPTHGPKDMEQQHNSRHPLNKYKMTLGSITKTEDCNSHKGQPTTCQMTKEQTQTPTAQRSRTNLPIYLRKSPHLHQNKNAMLKYIGNIGQPSGDGERQCTDLPEKSDEGSSVVAKGKVIQKAKVSEGTTSLTI